MVISVTILAAAAAEHLVYWYVVKLAVQVPERHIDRGLGACVSQDAALQGEHQVFKIVHLAAEQVGAIWSRTAPMIAPAVSPVTAPVGARSPWTDRTGVRVYLNDHVLDGGD